jgi:hypothetical protein
LDLIFQSVGARLDNTDGERSVTVGVDRGFIEEYRCLTNCNIFSGVTVFQVTDYGVVASSAAVSKTSISAVSDGGVI